MKKRKDVSGVGDRIKILRTEALQMTQKQLAEALEITRETLSRYESGRAPVPEKRIRELKHFVETKTRKGLNGYWLYYGEGEMYEEDEILSITERNTHRYEQAVEHFVNVCAQLGVEVTSNDKGGRWFAFSGTDRSLNAHGLMMYSVDESVFRKFVETFGEALSDIEKSIARSILDTYLLNYDAKYDAKIRTVPPKKTKHRRN